MTLVEVLGRRGHVVHRVRVTGNEVVIGRAYDSDVILDDPYVDPHALRLVVSEAGAMAVHDMGATNPVYVGDEELAGPAHPVVEGDTVRVGRTRLRIVRESTPVEPALAEHAGRFGALLARRSAAAVAALCFAVFWAVTSYAGEVEEFTPAVLTGELFGILVLVAVWAGCWSLATRLAQGRAAFLEHSTWTLLIASISIPTGSALALLSFLWPSGWMEVLSVAWGLLLFGLLLDAHLGLVTRMADRSRRALSAAIATSLVVLVYVVASVDQAYDAPVQEALGSLYPVPAAMIPATSTEGFLESAQSLEGRLSDMLDEG